MASDESFETYNMQSYGAANMISGTVAECIVYDAGSLKRQSRWLKSFGAAPTWCRYTRRSPIRSGEDETLCRTLADSLESGVSPYSLGVPRPVGFLLTVYRLTCSTAKVQRYATPTESGSFVPVTGTTSAKRSSIVPRGEGRVVHRPLYLIVPVPQPRESRRKRIGKRIGRILSRLTCVDWIDHQENIQRPYQASQIDPTLASQEIKYRRVSELTGSDFASSPRTPVGGYYTADHSSVAPISEMSPDSPPVELYSPPPESASDTDRGQDYFTAGKRCGVRAFRHSIHNYTPITAVVELPGDDGFDFENIQVDAVSQPASALQSQPPWNTTLSTNIDRRLADHKLVAPYMATSDLDSTPQTELPSYDNLFPDSRVAAAEEMCAASPRDRKLQYAIDNSSYSLNDAQLLMRCHPALDLSVGGYAQTLPALSPQTDSQKSSPISPQTPCTASNASMISHTTCTSFEFTVPLKQSDPLQNQFLDISRFSAGSLMGEYDEPWFQPENEIVPIVSTAQLPDRDSRVIDTSVQMDYLQRADLTDTQSGCQQTAEPLSWPYAFEEGDDEATCRTKTLLGTWQNTGYETWAREHDQDSVNPAVDATIDRSEMFHQQQQPFLHDQCAGITPNLSQAEASPSTKKTYPLVACDHCEQQFTGQYAQGNMKRHVSQKHTLKRNYTCRFCDKTYGRSDAVRNHERKMHPALAYTVPRIVHNIPRKAVPSE